MTPLGALPRLSPSARRALYVVGALAAGNAVALIVQAWALASALALVVNASAGPAVIGDRLVVLAAAVVARAGLGWAMDTASARAAVGAKEELRAALLDSALRRGPEWVQRAGPTELTVLATKGLDALDAYFSRYLPALLTAAVVTPMVGAWILFSDWLSALAIVCTVPLIPLFAWLIGRFTEKRTAHATDAMQRLSAHLLELIRALPVLTAFGRAQAQGQVVGRLSESHRHTAGATLRVAFLSALVLELLSSLSVALVAVGIGLRLVSGDLDLTTGLLVLMLAPECYLPLRAAGAAHHASEDGVEAVRRVDAVLTEPASAAGHRPFAPVDGTLQVEGLRVARRDGFAPDGLTFVARRGDILRLDGFGGIGPSGSGKSTTFAALLGFAEIAEGSVRFGGVDMRDADPADWRHVIAWVPQRPVFTAATVLDELRIAVSDQPPMTAADEERVLAEAAASALRYRRIDELSTGERQRVAVARALLRLRGRARLLLLDEPTAHLDGATAQHVNAAIRRAAERGATVVLASHRPGTEATGSASELSTVRIVEPEVPRAPGKIRDLVSARGVLGALLGALSLLSGIALAATSAWLIARASQHPPILTLSVAVVGVRTFALSRSALRYAERLITHDAAFRLATKLRRRLWEGLVRLGPVRASALRRNEGVARIVDDADAVRDLIPRVAVPPLVAAIVAIGAVTLETAVLPAAGLFLAAALLTAATGGSLAVLAAERRATTAAAEVRRRLAAGIRTLLDGSAELLAFGAHTERRAELAATDTALSARARRASFGAGVATATITLAMGIAALGGAWLGAQAAAGGRLAPVMVPVLALVPLATAEAVAALPGAAQHWRSLRAAQGRLAELLAAGPLQRRPERSDGVALEGVDTRWPGTAEPSLRGVSLRIPRGTHVAVVGQSGSGKSTLLALLLGFLPAERGTVRVPQRIAWCPQEPHLVSTTVRENLLLAAPHATDDQLADALALAGLPGWRQHLGDKVGAGGSTLSGGQAQRVALARALLMDAELILLDEPTAHLDVPTSEDLLARICQTFRHRTVVHVTHRRSETEHADVIVHVANGRVTVAALPGAIAS